jgi:signal transduction histidine kinase
MGSTEVKRLCIEAREEKGTVAIRFEDSGTGVTAPERLFQPFQRGAESSGLGLYVSKAIMRSFGGELSYEPRSEGSCFAVILPLGVAQEKVANG